MTTRTRKPKAPTTLAPLPRDAKLLSLDVSSTAIGWAILRADRMQPESFGLIKAPAAWDAVRRMREHARQIGREITGEGLTHAVMEWQSPWRAARMRNATGLAVLGEAQGYTLRSLEIFFAGDVPIDLVSERTWTVRNGWPASKESRAAQVRLLCPDYAARCREQPGWDGGLDSADAIGLGLWRLSIR